MWQHRLSWAFLFLGSFQSSNPWSYGILVAAAKARNEHHLREACMRRLRRTDFNEDGFQSGWMKQVNLSAFLDCIHKLQTNLRVREKVVHAGGVHYPTLIVTGHRHPVVSTSGTSWCWRGIPGRRPADFSAEMCCNQAHGPTGLPACWDKHFTYELCCRGRLDLGELPHNYVVPAFDINVGNTVKRRGTFDLRMSYALQALVRRGQTVIDVGANIGGFTVPLAERVGPSGKVHAFEAYRTVFQHLNANVALNGLANVFTYNVAVGRHAHRVEVFTPDLRTFTVPSAMRVEHQHTPDVAAQYDNLAYESKKAWLEVQPLDSFDFGEKVHFIKIDVEFMELEVVLGAKATILRHRPVIWAENEPFFKKNPPDRTFVDTMMAEFQYNCQTVADLELLCTPPERTQEVIGGVNRLMRYLNAPMKFMNLQQILEEAEPNFWIQPP